MVDHPIPPLDLLPLVLYRTPPGLRALLERDGVPFEAHHDPESAIAARCKFILSDGPPALRLARRLGGDSQHVIIDVNDLRAGFAADPFQCVLDHRGAARHFPAGALRLVERVARVDAARVGAQVLDSLQTAIRSAGGVWMRVARFPWPYRSAFNFRVDLDEPVPEDYWRFARARRLLADCTTHFVSTAAYGADHAVMRDLARYDTQSHGHFHHVYRDRLANRENLRRAHQVLADQGIAAVGFAGPGGRWNSGLDAELEDLGYQYSSEFQVAFDDWPGYPWRDGAFSKVLQVPIHPVCEGLFFEAGQHDPRAVADYFTRVLARKVAAGQPAFLYGHPEGRLGRFPAIVEAIAAALAREELVWRVTLTDFAAWWRKRAALRFRARRAKFGRLEIVFDKAPDGEAYALEQDLGETLSLTPLKGKIMSIGESEAPRPFKKNLRFDAGSELAPPYSSPQTWLRRALDWETVTPLDELPTRTIRARLKKGLRWVRQRRSEAAG
jgi:hypothetical protein